MSAIRDLRTLRVVADLLVERPGMTPNRDGRAFYVSPENCFVTAHELAALVRLGGAGDVGYETSDIWFNDFPSSGGGRLHLQERGEDRRWHTVAVWDLP